jgi:hypothetical protein
MIDFLSKNIGIIMTILFLISELLGENKRFTSNSVYSAIRTFLKGQSVAAKPKVDLLLRDESNPPIPPLR